MRKSEFEWVAEMRAAYSKQLAEQRASMGARIEADRKNIERLRAECAGHRFVAKAYDEALDQVTIEGQTPAECIRELRIKLAESERAKVVALEEHETTRQWAEGVREASALQERQLKAQRAANRHPVAVGEWVRRIAQPNIGLVGKVDHVRQEYKDYVIDPRHGGTWKWSDCEPCPPTALNHPPTASHDTVAGKAAAEEVKDSRSVAWAHPVERYSDPEPELYQPSEAERAETARIRAKWAQRADPQSEGQP